MYCSNCGKHFPSLCTCADRDARLRSLSQAQNIAMSFCSGCGEHADMCACPEPKPERELRAAGQIIGKP